ncbi:hypothetical protein M378DRAFT_398314 [Amanita muscaria Koide BX008]|uniref:Uncharacterized protein n=1 Tax=Amanita muscaria (strain Koide BX008) TaxID=946122 RepID=A0A0C2ST75_AMAMK|nr:hypothetical protein M378DRAFT_398314 [Amanita muscaria Koide BX008]
MKDELNTSGNHSSSSTGKHLTRKLFHKFQQPSQQLISIPVPPHAAETRSSRLLQLLDSILHQSTSEFSQ